MEVAPFNFISIIALVLAIAVFGFVFVQDDRTEDMIAEEIEPLTLAVNGLLEKEVDEKKVQSWVNSANTALIKRVDQLESDVESIPEPTSGVSESRVNQLIDNKILVQYDIDGNINALKAKDTALQEDIDDLDSAGSSSSRGDDDTTMDSVSRFYDRGDSITFTGKTEPRDEVELFLKHEDDNRFDDTGLTDTADQNGLWVIICRSICTDDRGDWEVYVENLDNGDESRVLDYQVD